MFSVLTTLKVLALAISLLNPNLIKEISEAVGAGVTLTEGMLNHETGEVKKQNTIKLVNESLDVIFIKFPVSDTQKTFIEDQFVPNAIEWTVWGLTKLGFFGKKTEEQKTDLQKSNPNFIGPQPISN